MSMNEQNEPVITPILPEELSGDPLPAPPAVPPMPGFLAEMEAKFAEEQNAKAEAEAEAFSVEEPAAQPAPETETVPEESAQPASEPENAPEAASEPAAPEAAEPAEVPAETAAPSGEQLNTVLDAVQNAGSSISEQIAQNRTAVMGEFDKLRTKMSDVDARVSSLRRLADMHQDIEKKLNDELNEYKDNFYRRIVNPILVEFFEIQEDMHADAMTAEESAAKQILEYVDAISRTLKHYGVTVETVAVGDTYDPALHKPVRAVPTDDPALDKTVAKTRQTLVHFIDGKIVERAQVQVYQYTPAAPETPETPAAEEAAE